MQFLKGQAFKIVLSLGLAVAVIGAFLVGIKLFESKVIDKSENEITYDSSYNSGKGDTIISVGGKEYRQKKNIETILVIGLDSTGEMVSSGAATNSERCDFVTLIAVDNDAQKCEVIQFNRDTMCDIPVLTSTGETSGSINAQLAYAHTYGSGMSDSCKNVVETIENLCFGTEIDHYVCLNMDAIGKLNDIVGGVTVEVLDDFPDVPQLVKGETVTLQGDLSMIYIRGRKGVGDQTNVSRMKRQKQYMEAFIEQFRIAAEDNSSIAVSAYNAAGKYMITDCSVNTISELFNAVIDYEVGEIRIPEGNNVKGESLMEFYIDDDSLRQNILDIFYEEYTE